MTTRFSNTLLLAVAAASIGIIASIILGLSAAGTPGGLADRFCTFFGALASALPTPWIGPMLLIAFAVWIPIFPTGGSVVLPAFTLSIGFTGLWSRLIRLRVKQTLRDGASSGARARGLSETAILLKYGLAPCAGALVAYFGTQFGQMLTGAFVTEVIFDWKGLGSLFVDAVLKRDYPIVEAATFVAATASLLGTLFGDWARQSIDPRGASE